MDENHFNTALRFLQETYNALKNKDGLLILKLEGEKGIFIQEEVPSGQLDGIFYFFLDLTTDFNLKELLSFSPGKIKRISQGFVRDCSDASLEMIFYTLNPDKTIKKTQERVDVGKLRWKQRPEWISKKP